MVYRAGLLSKDAPAPSPHLSQAIHHNGVVYCSGAFGIHPTTRKLVGGAYEQTKKALENLDAIAKEGGTRLCWALKVTIYIHTMDDYAEINRAYIEFFTTDPKPARTCIAVAQLPNKEAALEMEAIVAMPPDEQSKRTSSRL